MAHQAPPPPEKSSSFKDADSGTPSVNAASEEPIEDESKVSNGDGSGDGSSHPDPGLSQVLERVDSFLEKLGAEEDHDAVEIPECAEILSKTVEAMVEKCAYPADACKLGNKDDHEDEDDSEFFDAVDRLAKLSVRLGELSPGPAVTSSLNQSSAVLQRAMLYLEDELRTILENVPKGGGGKIDHHHHPSEGNVNQKQSKSAAKNSSSNSHHGSSEHVGEPESAGAADEDAFPGFTPEAVTKMNKIATAMIQAGYENECFIVYSMMRRNTFKAALINLGFEIISIDELQKMQWESLEGEIASWISIMRQCSTSLFAKERKLCESVFSNHPEVSRRLFGNLARALCLQFLNFAEAAMMTKRSAEKLFKFLDMYEAVRDLGCSVSGGGDIPEEEELESEIEIAKAQIGDTAVSMFGELENSIHSDNGRNPVPSGTVHPLTRYTMNYLEYACVYRDTLEQVFHKHRARAGDGTVPEHVDPPKEGGKGRTEFALQLVRVMELLDLNLDTKSRLYRDPSLRYIFLMNNGRYILQKIKGSAEIHEVMGDTWCRKRSTDLRGYHKNYQRETWYRLLQCLSHEGLSVNGKVSKPVLKERFKSFNTMFDDIHKTQSTWVVSDEQLQSELRVSIAAVVTPAYRSFLGRFNQYLDAGRQSEKYIKYQPEDIESLIDDLFDGNPTSMGRRRT